MQVAQDLSDAAFCLNTQYDLLFFVQVLQGLTDTVLCLNTH